MAALTDIALAWGAMAHGDEKTVGAITCPSYRHRDTVDQHDLVARD